MPGADTSCHEMTRRACGAAGFMPRPIVTANDCSVLSALVAAEAGTVLIPSHGPAPRHRGDQPAPAGGTRRPHGGGPTPAPATPACHESGSCWRHSATPPRT
ncbi:hypothetical protein [[Actinomadura] parvosata]|uniref:hypothetical protein n=1 Tax=[Actinomadura] parvosata TaxID=1955412 RepID=UPI0009ACFC19